MYYLIYLKNIHVSRQLPNTYVSNDICNSKAVINQLAIFRQSRQQTMPIYFQNAVRWLRTIWERLCISQTKKWQKKRVRELTSFRTIFLCVLYYAFRYLWALYGFFNNKYVLDGSWILVFFGGSKFGFRVGEQRPVREVRSLIFALGSAPAALNLVWILGFLGESGSRFDVRILLKQEGSGTYKFGRYFKV